MTDVYKWSRLLFLIPFALAACSKRPVQLHAPADAVTNIQTDTRAEHPPGSPADTGTGAPDGGPPCAKALALVKADLAARLGVSVDVVTSVKIEEVTWPDGCLGVEQPEMCSPNPVPGCRITLSARGGNHEYHTNQDESFSYAGPRP